MAHATFGNVDELRALSAVLLRELQAVLVSQRPLVTQLGSKCLGPPHSTQQAGAVTCQARAATHSYTEAHALARRSALSATLYALGPRGRAHAPPGFRGGARGSGGAVTLAV